MSRLFTTSWKAQLFLNTESLRYINLCNNIKAEKIVFLTAIPIKSSKNDLYTYVGIATRVTNKELSCDWVDEINTNSRKPEEIICSTFDVEFPVTRYFKDTIMSLNVEGYQKRQARRLTPQLWQYGGNETKNDVCVSGQKGANNYYDKSTIHLPRQYIPCFVTPYKY